MLRKLVSSVMFLCAVTAVPAAARQMIMDGPPPAVKKNLDAYKAALNGTAEEYEAMATTAFGDTLLKSQTPAERKTEFQKMRAAFGKMTFGPAQKMGPDAPAEISIKGSLGDGTLWLNIDDDSGKLTGIQVEYPKKH